MKRAMVVMVALLAMVAFVSGVMAQAPAQTKKPKALKFGGAVVGYEAGKMIQVKRDSGTEMTFSITKNTQMQGEVKEGAKATVTYKKDGDKMVATAIAVAPGKKPPKNAPETAPEKK